MQKPDFTLVLRNKQYKATPGRVALLEVLWKAGTPLSVQVISKKLRRPMNEVTLYRALEALAASGVVRRVDLGNNSTHYEFEKKHHHHLVCMNCKKLEDFVGCNIEQITKKALQQSRTFSTITSHSFDLYGLCRECAV